MKFYIAAKFCARHRIKPLNARLEELGFENTCPWFLFDVDDSADLDSLGGYSKEEHAEQAIRDIDAVRPADVFIIDTFDETNTGGREVELGAAIILNKRIEMVGPIRNIFHMHPNVRMWKDWHSLIEGMKDQYCYSLNRGGKNE